MIDHLDRRKPSKSRKYLAKGRPDFVTREFDSLPRTEEDALKWRDNWIADMKIKHGRKFDIRDVSSMAYVVDGPKGRTVLIELEYTPERTRT